MQYDFYFPSVSARFGLKWPSRVIETLRKNLVQLNLSASDKIVEGESIAVPNKDIDLPKAFDEGKDEFLLEYRIFSAVCACSGSELSAAIFDTNVRILP